MLRKIALWIWEWINIHPIFSIITLFLLGAISTLLLLALLFPRKKLQFFRIPALICLILLAIFPITNYWKNQKQQNYPKLKGEDVLINLDEKYLFGIDVSQYNGKINWEEVQQSKYPINFVFIRSSMGLNGKDKRFVYNWEKAKSIGLLCGAYHYYRPNENSTEQFNNFKSTYTYQIGDLPPVLDIEEMSIYGSENLRKGIQNFIQKIEDHYKVKPIIYSGKTFYLQHLKGYFPKHLIWIAAYSGTDKVKQINWDFYQFSDQLQIKGIPSYVDGNYFKGNLQSLQILTNKQVIN